MKKTVLNLAFAALLCLGGYVSAQNNNPHNHIDSILEEVGAIPSDTGQVLKLSAIAHDLAKVNTKVSLPLAKKAYKKARKLSYDKGISNSLDALGTVYENEDNQDSSFYYYSALKRFLKKSGYTSTKLQQSTLSNLGVYYVRNSNYDSATKYLELALEIVRSDSIKLPEAGILNNYANLYSRFGNWEKAADYYIQAQEIYKELGDTNALGIVYENLSDLKMKVGQFDEGMRYKKKAIGIFKRTKNFHDLARTYNNIGIQYDKRENHDSARSYYVKALKMCRSQGFDGTRAMVYLNLGGIYAYNKDYRAAKAYYDSSVAICTDLGIEVGIAHNLDALSHMYWQMKEYKKTEFYLDSLGRLLQKFPVTDLKISRLRRMYRLKKAQGQYQQALDHYEQYEQLNDSIKAKQNSQKVMQLEKQYELGQKEQENELLKLRAKQSEATTENQQLQIGVLTIGILALVIVVIIMYRNHFSQKKAGLVLEEKNKAIEEHRNKIEKQNERLQQTNKDKEKILKTVSHDFKNQISNILGIASLMEQEGSPTKMQRELVQLLHESAEKSLTLIAELYKEQAVELQRFSAHENAEKVLTGFRVQAENKRITLKNNLREDFELITSKEYLVRILENLVSNAIKYSKENTTVTISGKENHKQSYLYIEDEGLGMSKEDLEQIFKPNTRLSAKPTAGEDSTGLGLFIVKQLIDKIQADILVESEKGKGTKFTLVFNHPEKVS